MPTITLKYLNLLVTRKMSKRVTLALKVGQIKPVSSTVEFLANVHYHYWATENSDLLEKGDFKYCLHLMFGVG